MIWNHLWQSTLFAALAAVACWLLRGRSPRLRYWIWLAASLKFLVPFALLIGAGERVQPPAQTVHTPLLTAVQVEAASTVFLPLAAAPAPAPVWGWVWLVGVVSVVLVRGRQWFQLMSLRRAARPLAGLPMAACETDAAIEPGVVGIARPVLMLPAGLADALPPEQMRAIIDHELCHVRYRDNLTAALHMVVEALFWFHPLVWWMGARLIAERERHCDEHVLAGGGAPEDYAQGIVNVCRHYLPVALPCAAGVTGADLKARIRAILQAQVSRPMTRQGQAALAAVAVAMLMAPVAIGVLRAQTMPPEPKYKYEVATIRPSNATGGDSRIGPGPQGGLRSTNVTIETLLGFAYDVREHQLDGLPAWVKNDRWDISFTPDTPENFKPDMKRDEMDSMFSRQRQRMQSVLRDRFGLVMRIEQKERAFYGLVEVKGGHKMQAGEKTGPSLMVGPGRIQASNIYLAGLTQGLSGLMGRHVINETKLDGPFTFELTFPAGEESRQGPSESDRAALIAAMPEQIGLRLEARKGPVPVYVVERITKPEAN